VGTTSNSDYGMQKDGLGGNKDFSIKRFRRSQGRSDIMGGGSGTNAHVPMRVRVHGTRCTDVPMDNTTASATHTRDSETRR
jgi:hypothetical protein